MFLTSTGPMAIFFVTKTQTWNEYMDWINFKDSTISGIILQFSGEVTGKTLGRRRHIIWCHRLAFVFQRNGYQYATLARQLIQKKKQLFTQILSHGSSCWGLAGEMFSYLLWPIMVCFILPSFCSILDSLKVRAVRYCFCIIQWTNRKLKNEG